MRPAFTLLYIDSRPDRIAQMRRWVETHRDAAFAVEAATTLAEGLASLSTNAVDAVVVNLRLPEAHCVETLRRLRPFAQTMPVIFTAEDDRFAGDAFRIGAQDYLTRDTATCERLLRATRHAIERMKIIMQFRQGQLQLEGMIGAYSADLQQLNRAFQMVSVCNEAVLRASDEKSLIQTICQTIVGVGAYRRAQVALVESGDITFVCHPPGAEASCLDQDLSAGTAPELNWGASAPALSGREPVILRNIALPRGPGASRGKAQSDGSAIVLPLFATDEEHGTLLVHADDPGAFSPHEVKLLTRLADNLAYGITALRTKVRRDLAERARQESEERFRALVQNSADTIAVFKADGTLTFVSPSAEHLLDYPPDEMVGTNVLDLIHPEDVPNVRAMLEDFVGQEGRTVLNTEFRIRHKDGSWRVFNVSCHNQLRNPVVAGIIANARDITEQKQAEAELANRTSDLLLLNEVIQIAASSLDAQVILTLICRKLALSIDVPQATAALVGPDGRSATVVAEYIASGRPTALGVDLSPTTLFEDDRLQSGKPLEMEGVPNHAQLSDLPAPLVRGGIQSLLIVPLLAQGSVTGTISLETPEPRAFTQREVQLATSTAAAASQALENARLHEEEQSQLAFAQALARSSALVNSRPNLDEMLEHILDSLGEVVPHDFAGISVIDAGIDRPLRSQERHPHGLVEAAMQLELRVQDFPNLRRMMESKQPDVIPYLPDDPEWVQIDCFDCMQSYAGTPILSDNEVVGFIRLLSTTPHFYTAAHATRLKAFADQIGLAIRNAWLFEASQTRARHLAALHELTQQFRKSGFDLDSMLDAAAKGILRYFDAGLARIWLVDGGNQDLVLRASAGAEAYADSDAGGAASGEPQPQSGRTVQEKWLASRPLAPYARLGQMDDEAKGAVNRVRVQLTKDARTLGELTVYSRQPFDPSVRDMLSAFANQLALAIDNVQLYSELETHNKRLESAVAERTAQLQGAVERIEAILNSSSDAIVLATEEGKISQANPAFSLLFSQSGDDIFRQPLTVLVSRDHCEAMEKALKGLWADGTARRLEVSACPRDQPPFPADISLATYPRVGRFHGGIVCSIRDMTEHKRSQEQLLAALQRERELSELKTSFVSMASHEFRTPLTAIVSSAELLERYLDKMDTTRKANHFAKIRTAVDLMTDLLDDVLTLGKVESERIEVKRKVFDMVVLCQTVIEEVQLSAGENVAFELTSTEPQITVVMDEALARHILLNLVSNAAKYSPDGGTVKVEVEKEPDQLRLSVADQGIGIPVDDQGRLFEPFFRAKNVETIKGFGLGLTITRRAVTLLGGTVSFESQPGKGTRFAVTLPLQSTVEMKT